jgi:hypothetical protein
VTGRFKGFTPTTTTAQASGIWTLEDQFGARDRSEWPLAGSVPSGDPFFSSVLLLLHFDGADGSQSFIDSSPSNLTVAVEGGVEISTGQAKFGGSSGLFGANYSYLNVTGNLSSGSYTVETWFFAGQGNSGDHYNVVGGGFHNYPNRWALDIGIAEGAISLRTLGGSNDPLLEYSGDYTLSTWAHVAWVNNVTANTLSVYLDGERIGQDVAFNPTNHVGGIQVGGNSGAFNAATYYLDELRISAVARYSGTSFSPPTAPFLNA